MSLPSFYLDALVSFQHTNCFKKTHTRNKKIKHLKLCTYLYKLKITLIQFQSTFLESLVLEELKYLFSAIKVAFSNYKSNTNQHLITTIIIYLFFKFNKIQKLNYFCYLYFLEESKKLKCISLKYCTNVPMKYKGHLKYCYEKDMSQYKGHNLELSL
jgi:hypothetical protein